MAKALKRQKVDLQSPSGLGTYTKPRGQSPSNRKHREPGPHERSIVKNALYGKDLGIK
jgi:hypothetical protein